MKLAHSETIISTGSLETVVGAINAREDNKLVKFNGIYDNRFSDEMAVEFILLQEPEDVGEVSVHLFGLKAAGARFDEELARKSIIREMGIG